MRTIVKDWWKYLGLLLLFYVFSIGFLIPLRPGIMHISPDRMNTGEEGVIRMSLYNTQFTTEDDVRIFIRLDSVHIAEAKQVIMLNRNTLDASFHIPHDLPESKSFANASLVVHHPETGFVVSPSALTLALDTSVVKNEAISWTDRINLEEGPWKLQFPFVGILYETIRNTFFHVAIWFAMFFLMTVSLFNCLKYLYRPSLKTDIFAASFAYVSILFGIMGMITGSLWAKHTWGVYWTSDPKLNMAAVALIIYIAYAILRSAMTDTDRRARVSAAYNIFAFVAMIPLVFIIPRMTSSLHPGNGGNPALGGEDLDNTLRIFFYPSILALILIGAWMATMLVRVQRLELNKLEQELL